VKPPRLPGPSTEDAEETRMPLLEHLRELRHRLLVAVGAVLAGMAVCFAFASELLAFMTAPMREVLGGLDDTAVDRAYTFLTVPIHRVYEPVISEGTLAITSSPLEGVYTYMLVAAAGGAILASPVVTYQLWRFVAPGLYKTERRVVLPLALSSTLMFLLGSLFAYAVIFPVAFPFFLTVIDAEAVLSIDGYLKTVVRMMLAFGLCFQLPVGTWFLARLGLVDHKDMIKGFRYAVVAIFVIAAIITPPDILTQILLGVPLVILYGVGIVVAYFATSKVREPEATD
jgi:sec-independent protein translocase protein TatC